MTAPPPREEVPRSNAFFRPRARYDRLIRRIAVLHRGVSPTTDIYLRRRLDSAAVPVAYHDILEEMPRSRFGDGTFVVIVRYLNVPWARALWAAQDRLSGVAYLMDDDIPGASSDPGLPRAYARKLGLFWATFRPILARLVSEVWLTSGRLEALYGGANVHRMDPLYIGTARARPPVSHQGDQPVRVFYHGGRTHGANRTWLRDVIQGVQAARADTVFEIFGDAGTVQAFAGIPRCRVLQRLPWRDYLAYAAGESLDIGLAPAAPGTFNAARSFNKAYDITRAGAAGVYADVANFRDFVADGREGLLVPDDDPDAWIRAILQLVDDPGWRREIHAAALARASQIAQREMASPSLHRFQAPGPANPP